jgi:hypothetical protein
MQTGRVCGARVASSTTREPTGAYQVAPLAASDHRMKLTGRGGRCSEGGRGGSAWGARLRERAAPFSLCGNVRRTLRLDRCALSSGHDEG